ncbi:hypothetical protein L596_000404 [Steinernema carpocapsae]|uniref:Uncharacterized protein n=1 Tax=Steinernema carpocapsae TaxID=34508 RepID=A0A4U8UI96_STECR|nr:hypothetical protein L596_000404 [Steinernema carpocapsae]
MPCRVVTLLACLLAGFAFPQPTLCDNTTLTTFENSLCKNTVGFKTLCDFTEFYCCRIGPFRKVYNSDQTGLQLELRAGRTLATKGVKKVEVVVQRKNALTHTPNPPTRDQLCRTTPTAPVCLLPRMESPAMLLPRTPRVYSSALRTLQERAYDHEDMDRGNSWPGYKKAQEEFGGPEKIDFLTIPPRTTGHRTTPTLDVFFNRQLKAFHRRLNRASLPPKARIRCCGPDRSHLNLVNGC